MINKIKKYIEWIANLSLLKKILFSITSFVVTILFAFFLSIFMGINLLLYTSNIIRLLFFLIIKKGATLLFFNKLFVKLNERFSTSSSTSYENESIGEK